MANPLELTTAIVVAFAENNRLGAEELPDLIRTVHRSLEAAASGASEESKDEIARATPAQIRRSITPDAIISFEDGRPYKSMKRHLTRLGMTPAEYREKWGLASNYPMVAPNYSAARSEMAKALGLGARGRKAKTPVKGAPRPAKGRPAKS